MSDIAVNKVINAKGHPIEVTTVSGDFIYMQPATTAADAFGRLRNSLTGTPTELSVLVQTKVAGDDVYVAVDWEEISL